MEKILIIKASSLGDIIHVYPVINYLRRKFPHAQIDWIVEAPYAELVEAHPFVTHAIQIASKAWRRALFHRSTWNAIFDFRSRVRETVYDVIFDLQGNIKSGLVASQALSQNKVGFASRSVAEKPNLLFTNHRFNPPSNGNIREDYLSVVSSFFCDPMPTASGKTVLKISDENEKFLHRLLNQPKQRVQGPNVIVCPGSAWRNKQLTPETLASFLSSLQKFLNCHFFLVWGTQEEYAIVLQLHALFASCSTIVDKLSLPMLQNFMAMSDLVIAMDSLPLHLAGTTDIPSFSVFGASSANKYKPLGKQHQAFQGECPYGRSFEKRCPVLRSCSTGACIRDLEANKLFDSFRRWWNGE